MRSPHNPHPNVSLGDDADPASELGPRLAAASQTVQGLLTNYLFYGQRRATNQTSTAVRDLAGERGHERHSGDARASLAGHTRRVINADPSDQREPPARTDGVRQSQAGSPANAFGVPRFQLVVPPEPIGGPSERPASGASTSPTDPLAKDVLSEDPIARDPLALCPRDEPHPNRCAVPDHRLR